MYYELNNEKYLVEYIIRKNMKSIRMRLTNGKIVLSSYRPISDEEITKLLNKPSFSNFLEKNLKKIDNKGDKFYLNGKSYPCTITKSDFTNNVIFNEKDQRVIITVTDLNMVNDVVKRFYVEKTKILVNKIFDQCFEVFDYSQKPTLEFKFAKSYLGKCKCYQNTIVFSGVLSKYDEQQTKVTILHELCHFKYHDHGYGFKSLLNTKCAKMNLRNEKVQSIPGDIY